MIHPNTQIKYINDTVGYGVFATTFIPEGTIVYIKDSLEITVTPEDYLKHNNAMRGVIDKYSYIDEKGNKIVSWDFAKYVNHCCNFNTISTGYGFEIAIRDIQEGEQITDEYGIFNLEESMNLVCEKPNCRKIIQPSDFDTKYLEWDEIIKKSIIKLTQVEQPLMSFLDLYTINELNTFAKDHSNYKSIYNLKFVKNK